MYLWISIRTTIGETKYWVNKIKGMPIWRDVLESLLGFAPSWKSNLILSAGRAAGRICHSPCPFRSSLTHWSLASDHEVWDYVGSIFIPTRLIGGIVTRNASQNRSVDANLVMKHGPSYAEAVTSNSVGNSWKNQSAIGICPCTGDWFSRFFAGSV